MRKDSLINTNPYLRNLQHRQTMLVETVLSSTAIEGVHLDFKQLERSLFISDKPIKSCASLKSSGSRR
jgi:hypothetical protein